MVALSEELETKVEDPAEEVTLPNAGAALAEMIPKRAEVSPTEPMLTVT